MSQHRSAGSATARLPWRLTQLPWATLAAATLAAAPALAQETPPLRIEDAVSASDFQIQGKLAVFSPDGAWVAYTVCDPKRLQSEGAKLDTRATRGAAYASGGCGIWLSPAGGGGAPRNITPEAGNDWAPAWSPDGRAIAYLSDRGGTPRLWLWDLKSGKSRKISDEATRSQLGYEAPVWTPDGKQLVVKLRPEGVSLDELEGSSGIAAAEEKAEGSTVEILRSGEAERRAVGAREGERPTSAFGSHFLGDLALVDVATGRARRLARGTRATNYWLSPDGRNLAYLHLAGRDAAIRLRIELRVVELATGRERVLAGGIDQDFYGSVSWSPDGGALAYTSKAESVRGKGGEITSPSGGIVDGDLYLVRLDGGEPRKVAGVPDGSVSTTFLPPLWDERGERIVATGGGKLWVASVATGRIAEVPTGEDYRFRLLLQTGEGRIWTPDGGRSVHVLGTNLRTLENGFYRVELESGRVTPLFEAMRSFGSVFELPAVSVDGRRIVFLSESVTESADLWAADAGFRAPERLTSINPQLDRYAFGASRSIEFRSADGKPLRANLLLPAGYQEGRRYPMVVWVYASDANVIRNLTSFGMVGYSAYNMHMLTTRGYAVLWPDIPVSVGSPMQDLMKAVMPAIDRVVEMGIADPERLAVMGQSNGGYSTLSLVAQTNRFKAAVMNAGFGDLTAFYGSMSPDGSGGWHPWLEQMGGAMGAPPWDAPLRYVQNSPIYFLDRVETPMLIQAGTSDSGIIPFSDQVFVGLKRLGKDVTYLRYGGEGHVLASYPNLLDYWQRVTAFLEEHLRKREVRAAATDR